MMGTGKWWELVVIFAIGVVAGFVVWTFPGWKPVMAGESWLDLMTAIGTVGATGVVAGSAFYGWAARRSETRRKAWFVLSQNQTALESLDLSIKMMIDTLSIRGLYQYSQFKWRLATGPINDLKFSVSDEAYLALIAVSASAVADLRLVIEGRGRLLMHSSGLFTDKEPPIEPGDFMLTFFVEQSLPILSALGRLERLRDRLAGGIS